MDDLSRNDLIAKLADRDALIETLQEQLKQQVEINRTLANEVKLLKRALFGNRRERFDDPRQGLLFNGEWMDEPEAEAEQESTPEPPPAPKRKPRRRGRLVFPEALPRKQVVHRLKDEDIPEHLRGRDDVRRFLKKVQQYVDVEPSTAYVVEEYVEVVAVDNADATATKMLTASRPKRILDGYAGPSLLASLAVERFADYLPYYRVEDRLSRLGLSIPRATIARWMIKLARQLLRLVQPIRESVLASDVLCMDETPVKLLRPGEGKASTAYLWTAVGDASHPYNAFYFTENRSRAGPAEILADFSGVLVSDAYVCYESLQSEWSDRMQWACCHAHARRKFEELDYLGPTKQTTRALAYFRQLFDIEDEAREMSNEERHALRAQKSRPLLQSMKTWMDEQLQTLRPKHPLRGPIQYMTQRWDSFTRFLDSGAIPIENNAAERSVKLPVIAKKNHLFFASPHGGEAAMVFYTLTATCRRLHVDPYAYLSDVFRRLPQLTGGEVLELLPDRWLAANPQHRVTQREREAVRRRERKKNSRAQRRKILNRKLRRS